METGKKPRSDGMALGKMRVLELASMVAGPYCGKLLADAGTEVIKIERPGEGDEARRYGPFIHDVPNLENSLLFMHLNTNKLGITLDIESKTGQELLRKLVSISDILIEDLPVGKLASIGLDYQVLQQINPGLIITSITPFGQTGSHRNYKAYEINTYHIGNEGWLTPTGLSCRMFPNRQPIKAGGHIGDYYVGVTAGVATMGAIFARKSDGLGQHVDISKQECILSITRRSVEAYANLGALETRYTRDFNYGGVFPCKNGYAQIMILGENLWHGLVRALGNPEWASREEYIDPQIRRQNGDKINAYITEWCSTRSTEEVFRICQECKVPAGIHNTTIDVLNSEHEKDRVFFNEVNYPGIGTLPLMRPPYIMSTIPWQLRRPAPRIGEHTSYVFGELLGLSKDEIIKLFEEQII